MVRRNLLNFCLLLAIIAWPTSASALTIPLDTEFGQDLSGDFGEVVLTDLGDEIEFDITIVDPFLGTTADLTGFYFNIDPDPLAGDILFTFDTPGSFTPTDNIDFTATDATNKADGDGYFDIFLDYSNDTTEDIAGCDGQGCLQHVVFRVGVNDPFDDLIDLSVDNFASFPPDPDTQSVGGEKGGFTVAARIRRIGIEGENSAWVGGNPIPEPATALLLGSGLLGLLGLSRRRFLKKS